MPADITLVNLNLLFMRYGQEIEREVHVPLGCLYLARAMEAAGFGVDVRDYQLAESDEPIILTRRGRPAAVLLSAEAYAQAARDRQVLRMLALGEMEAAAGVGEDLDLVIADADALLEEN